MEVLPKAVFLDWDGTLVDSYDFLLAAHNHVRGKLGLPLWDDHEFMDVLRFSTREIYPKLYGERESQARQILQDYLEDHHLAALKTADGAAALLETLQARGVPTGVISNKRHERLQAEIAHLGWERFFQVVAGAGLTAHDKPAPDMMAYALEKTGIPDDPVDVLYAGDMQTDLEFAGRSGVGAVFLLSGMGDAELVERFAPLYVYKDCRAFAGALAAAKERPK